MRVPCIIAWAQENKQAAVQKKLPIQAGAWSREMGTILDVVPTVSNLLGLTPKQTLDGADLAPALRGEKRDPEQSFLMHFPHEHRSSYYTVYRRGSWKLIYEYTKPAGKRCQLFDLANDPYETTDLAAQKPQQRDRMLAEMRKDLVAKGAQYVRTSKNDAEEILPIQP
jgi:arylsulfatase A-like enzyme